MFACIFIWLFILVIKDLADYSTVAHDIKIDMLLDLTSSINSCLTSTMLWTPCCMVVEQPIEESVFNMIRV